MLTEDVPSSHMVTYSQGEEAKTSRLMRGESEFLIDNQSSVFTGAEYVEALQITHYASTFIAYLSSKFVDLALVLTLNCD